ncbi:MAG: acyl-CoA thioesterase [Chloroflexi bacterium]|nr:acyl-CoA thioesterase [Chloroflexota bacterium]
MPEGFHFSMTQQVRFRDMDAMGHVNNSVYLTYLEEARIAYLQQMGQWRGDVRQIGTILAEVTIQFKAPAYFQEKLLVWMRTVELRNSSFIMEYVIESEAQPARLIALGRSVQVCYDYAEQKSVPIPDRLRQSITAYEKEAP